MNILIVGMGDVGLHLAKRLVARHDVTLIDKDHARVVAADGQVDAICIEGNASSPSTLKRAGIDKVDLLAAMTSSDELNILVCELGKYYGVKQTVCRIRNHEFADFTEDNPINRFGVDRLIHPEKEAADAIVQLIRQDVPSDAIPIADGAVQLTGFYLHRDSPVVRIPLKRLRVEHQDLPFRVVSVMRKDSTFIPGGNDALMPGDKIFVLCDPDHVEKVLELAGKNRGKIQNIMILGGGLVGQYVARDLGRSYNIKIIESSAEQSEHIADLLPDSLIIHGDGTDIDLLGVEGIIDMDVFIATTGSDEVNIISTLVARHLQVDRTVAMVNNVEYMPITPTIGLDAVVSRELLTVNGVMRYVQEERGGADIATIPGLSTRVLEYTIKPGAKVTRKAIKDLKFPRDATVAAVVSESGTSITHGDTQLQAGDRVVLLALPGAVPEVERLFK